MEKYNDFLKIVILVSNNTRKERKINTENVRQE